MIDEEIWMPVPSVHGVLASSHGRIKSVDRIGNMPHGGIRVYVGKPWPGAWAGKRYTAMIRGKTYRVARMVCEAFHGPAPDDKPNCLHGDEDARNNRPSNLRWGTQKENLNAPGFLAYCRGRVGLRSPATVGQRTRMNAMGRKRLALSDVSQIKRGIAEGEIGNDLARRYGVSAATISQIKSGKIWKAVGFNHEEGSH